MRKSVFLLAVSLLLVAACWSSGIAMLALPYVLACPGWATACIKHFTILLLVWSVWMSMPSCKLPEWLYQCAFPVFLMHVMVLPYVALAAEHAGIAGMPAAIAGLFFGVAVPVAVAVVLRKYTPRFADVIFGGR